MGDDYTTLVRYVEPFMRIDQLPIDTETVTLARYVIAKGDYHTAREVLENYQSSYPSGDAMDEVLFLLGRVYEESTEFRDIAGARGAYERVFRDFPESPLSEKANERVRFLNRHFFYIR